MDVLQCPECPLRFRFAAELEEHLALEHPDFKAKPPRPRRGLDVCRQAEPPDQE